MTDDRAVRLALQAGRYKAERDQARQQLAQLVHELLALAGEWQTVDRTTGAARQLLQTIEAHL